MTLLYTSLLKWLPVKPCTTLNSLFSFIVLSLHSLHNLHYSLALLRRQAATRVDHAGGTCIDVSNGRHLHVCFNTGFCVHHLHVNCLHNLHFFNVCVDIYGILYLSFYKAMVFLENAAYCLAIRTVPCPILLREPRWIHPDQLLLLVGGSRQCVLVLDPLSLRTPSFIHKKIPFFLW